MGELWIANASPIILLARVGLADLLVKLPEKVVVPEPVAFEIRAGPQDDPGRRWVEAGTAHIIAVPAPTAELLAWDLGAGETSVLSYALGNPGWTAILDDAAARKCAQSLSVASKGTLAVIVLAKQRGLIESAADTIHALQAAGFRIDDLLVRTVLAGTVNEEW